MTAVADFPNSPSRLPLIRIRWRIFAFLFGFGFIAYFQSKSITVAAAQIMPDLHVSQSQLGWLEQSFVVGYALFQMPGGIFGQRFGTRRTLVIISLIAFGAMIAFAVAPSLFAGESLYLALLLSQFLLGVAQAALFPVSAGVFDAWFPPNRWALVQGLQSMALQLGAAATGPLVSGLMLKMGWQMAVVWTSVPALGLIAWWAWYGRDTPRQHRAVRPGELAEIGSRDTSMSGTTITAARIWRVLKNRNAILLFVSYTCMNYVFYLIGNWAFLYLIQERNFSILESGWLATGPPLAAGVGAGLSGLASGWFCARYGNRWGYRLTPLIVLPLAGGMLLAVIYSANPYIAVAALAFCFALVELTEGSYWGSAMTIGGVDTMALTGFMNTGGNLGGIIGIPIVAQLSDAHRWNLAFIIGSGFALVSALCWLGIDAERPLVPLAVE